MLEISEDASPSDVRAAYFRMVRLHPPESDPDAFSEIARAYRVLADEVSRRDYDAALLARAGVARLAQSAKRHMAQGEWDMAARDLKHVIVLAPDRLDDRDLLGMCLARAGEWKGAREVYRSLVKRSPDVAKFWVRYGWSWLGPMEHPPGDEVEAAAWERGRSCLLRALDLDPKDVEPMWIMAQSYALEREWDRAGHWGRRSLEAGCSNVPDEWKTMRFLCDLYVETGRDADLERTLRDMTDIGGASAAALRFLSCDFAGTGARLAKEGRPVPADAFICAALRLYPDIGDGARAVRAFAPIGQEVEGNSGGWVPAPPFPNAAGTASQRLGEAWPQLLRKLINEFRREKG